MKINYAKAKSNIKKLLPMSVFRKVEPTGHLLEAMAYSLRYGRPARQMRVIGVTGTNGKTTTSFMIHRMLVESGIRTGLMTTVAYGVDDDIEPQIEHMTSVSPAVLNKRLKEMQEQGVEWLVLETTSHALAQYRVWGVEYEIAVVTNVTHEHLDYHGSFDEYRRAKQRLFEIVGKNPQGFAVVNADDQTAADYLGSVGQGESYGIDDGQLRALDIELTSEGSRYRASVSGENYQITCHLPGQFNVYNSLATAAVGRRAGLNKDQIERGIEALKFVEGRMNTVDAGQAYSVIVDFAHTPDAFEKLLSDIRRTTKGKLVVVFGSAGRRDEAKRAIQGEIAGGYADEVILTEEDDRDVDGQEILQQIAEGAKRSGKNVGDNLFLIADRTEAISFAITRVTEPADTVVFLGKGHEKTIERADGIHPWNETEVVKQAIVAGESTHSA